MESRLEESTKLQLHHQKKHGKRIQEMVFSEEPGAGSRIGGQRLVSFLQAVRQTASAAVDAMTNAVQSAEYSSYAPTVGILPARRAVADYLNQDLPYKLSPDDVYLIFGCLQAIEISLAALVRPGFRDSKKAWCSSDSDEVYAHLSFGSSQYVLMGVFGSIVPVLPVLTVGSMLKRWIVPGWRLGFVIQDNFLSIFTPEHSNVFKGQQNILECKDTANQHGDSQMGAVPQIIENSKEDFFVKIIGVLKEAADMCYDRINDQSPGYLLPLQVKLNLSMLEAIKDDLEFCLKLAREESVIVLPGLVVGMKNWLRITFAIEPSSLDDGLVRIKPFAKGMPRINKIKSEVL
ncbi:hypothetical protein SLEP1_g6703 [Rubroshorea leprosula]|uniref:Aminotransferase class I/classII large domain-containing protein n=1 Tax=Rubroshorea leprosula TaxID=152421 RepID=A0AAV5I701_9ROSI|nr:hypothetical protein SLEP1_g6703 [Rubroshorea leprosula]